MQNLLMLAGRVLLAAIFVYAGYGKIGAAYEGTQAYMVTQGVPGLLLPLVILLELGGGIAIILGLFTRLTSIALAFFCLASAVVFHSNLLLNDMQLFDILISRPLIFADEIQAILFMKNLAMAGGFLILAAHGPGDISLDNRNSRPASD